MTETQILFSGSYDASIKLQNLGTQRLISELAFDVPVCDIAVSPNKQYFAASGFNQIRVYNTQTLQQIQFLKPEQADYCVSSLSFDQSGQYLAASGEDGYLQVYETKNLECNPYTLREPCLLNCVSFCDNYLVLSTENGKIKIFDVRKYNELFKELDCFTFDLGVRWAEMHGNRLVCGDGRGLLQYYKNFELQCSIQAHQDSIMRIRFSEDGESIFTTSCDKQVKQWEFCNDKLIKYKEVMTAENTCFDCVPLKNSVICGCDKTPKFLKLENDQYQITKEFQSHTGLVTCLAVAE